MLFIKGRQTIHCTYCRNEAVYVSIKTTPADAPHKLSSQIALPATILVLPI